MLKTQLPIIAACTFFLSLLPDAARAQTEVQLDSTVLEMTVVAQDLDTPWEVLWGPDGYLWVTERYGLVSRINPETGGKTVVLDLESEVHEQSESGLLGMALHPDFEANPYVYLVYTYWAAGSITERLERYTYDGTALVSPMVLLDGIPGNTTHDGSRLLITPDLKLLMSTGDAQILAAPQDVAAINGKFLRMNLDGSVPSDNPVSGSLVWTWGHRNPQGLVMSPQGIIYSSEHGPNNDDEFNIIEGGVNYGWPDVEGFCDGGFEAAFCAANDVREPLAAWTPTLAVCGIDFYDHPAIPEWRNSVLMATLRDKTLWQLKLSGDGLQVDGEVPYLEDALGRLRDVCVAPDGRVFVATSNRDGRGSPIAEDDRIVQLRNPGYGIAEAGFEVQDNCLEINLVNNSANADSYVWLFGDGYGATTAEPSHTYDEGGEYEISLAASNIYGSSDTASITVLVEQCIAPGIGNANGGGIAVFPNPASDRLAVSYPPALSGEQLSLVNVEGKTLRTAILDGTGVFVLQREKLPAGLYYLCIGQEGGGQVIKITFR